MNAVEGRRRWIAAAIGALLAFSAAALGLSLREQTRFPARPPDERPDLLVLTSLPIIFPEQFTLQGSDSPALAALQSRYDIVPVSTADAGSLAGRNLLLMAQPQAQPGEILVELDQWVRRGGHLLLLADPALEWPSDRPLGDILRPLAAFPDTGLLGHWGLRLDGPNRRSSRSLNAGGYQIRTLSPGELVATGQQCRVEANRLIAHCRIGDGSATVIADADFLNPAQIEGASEAANLDLLLAELERLEQ